MGRWLLLPFFAFYLSVLGLPTLLRLIWALHHRKIVISLVILSLVLLASVFFLIPTTNSPTPQAPDSMKMELRNQYAQTLKLLEQQPSHRDLLINAARLAQELDNSTAAAEFTARARRVDPNSPLLY